MAMTDRSADKQKKKKKLLVGYFVTHVHLMNFPFKLFTALAL